MRVVHGSDQAARMRSVSPFVLLMQTKIVLVRRCNVVLLHSKCKFHCSSRHVVAVLAMLGLNVLICGLLRHERFCFSVQRSSLHWQERGFLVQHVFDFPHCFCRIVEILHSRCRVVFEMANCFYKCCFFLSWILLTSQLRSLLRRVLPLLLVTRSPGVVVCSHSVDDGDADVGISTATASSKPNVSYRCGGKRRSTQACGGGRGAAIHLRRLSHQSLPQLRSPLSKDDCRRQS